ncbi:hypothetical protein L1987_16896 [Smallanthus sonchifolius]|uniref:Uncharacterized protein n=1 Tax=Smallanthus sonchifolius TaxID=185202 RepID=A0ACB9IVZ6_9ASTR|nr:hypothetical protein L1987_16896 [Smallanthus sonchifolius]
MQFLYIAIKNISFFFHNSYISTANFHHLDIKGAGYIIKSRLLKEDLLEFMNSIFGDEKPFMEILIWSLREHDCQKNKLLSGVYN